MNNLKQTVKKLIGLCSHGLAKGVGVNKPGKMCVMAAVSIASGEPFTDKPDCVDYRLRTLCIALNDSGWANDYDRAQYLTPIAIASLGTLSMDDVAEMAIKIHKEHTGKYEQCCDEYKAKRKPFVDEYEAKSRSLWDEYEAKRKPLWDEYEAKRRPLLEEYNAKCKPLLDEYTAKRRPLLDEYNAKCKPLLDEYEAKCRQLLIETCETLLAELIRLETPGSKFLYLLEGK